MCDSNIRFISEGVNVFYVEVPNELMYFKFNSFCGSCFLNLSGDVWNSNGVAPVVRLHLGAVLSVSNVCVEKGLFIGLLHCNCVVLPHCEEIAIFLHCGVIMKVKFISVT